MTAIFILSGNYSIYTQGIFLPVPRTRLDTLFAVVVVPVKLHATRVFVIYAVVFAHPEVVPVDAVVTVLNVATIPDLLDKKTH